MMTMQGGVLKDRLRTRRGLEPKKPSGEGGTASEAGCEGLGMGMKKRDSFGGENDRWRWRLVAVFLVAAGGGFSSAAATTWTYDAGIEAAAAQGCVLVGFGGRGSGQPGAKANDAECPRISGCTRTFRHGARSHEGGANAERGASKERAES